MAYFENFWFMVKFKVIRYKKISVGRPDFGLIRNRLG